MIPLTVLAFTAVAWARGTGSLVKDLPRFRGAQAAFLDEPTPSTYGEVIESLNAALADANAAFEKSDAFTLNPLSVRSRWNQTLHRVTISAPTAILPSAPPLSRVVLVAGQSARNTMAALPAEWIVRHLTMWRRVMGPSGMPARLTELLNKYAIDIIVSANPDALSLNVVCPDVGGSFNADHNLRLKAGVPYPDAAGANREWWQTQCNSLRGQNNLDGRELQEGWATLKSSTPTDDDLAQLEPEIRAVWNDVFVDTPGRGPVKGAIVTASAQMAVLFPPTAQLKQTGAAWWLEAAAYRAANAMKSRSGRPYTVQRHVNWGGVGTVGTFCDTMQQVRSAAKTGFLCLTVAQSPSTVGATHDMNELMTALLDSASHLVQDGTNFGLRTGAHSAYLAAKGTGVEIKAIKSVLIDAAWDLDDDGVADVLDAVEEVRNNTLQDELVTIHVTASNSGIVAAIVLLVLLVHCLVAVLCFCFAPCCRRYHQKVDLPDVIGGGSIALPRIPAIGAFEGLGQPVPPDGMTPVGDEGGEEGGEAEGGEGYGYGDKR